MPGSATFITFGLGFIVATSLLHALGLVTGRVSACLLAFLMGGPAVADEAPGTSNANEGGVPTSLQSSSVDEVVVLGRADSLIGIADSASEGNIGQAQIETRPILRPGEVLETVPGLIVSQHSGEGKANQYYSAASIWTTARIS